MGRKVHPTGFRIGIIRGWQSKWYSGKKQYIDYLHEDLKLRKAIVTKYPDAGVSLIEVDRQANKIAVAIHTSRPGIVIGRGGQRVEEMRQTVLLALPTIGLPSMMAALSWLDDIIEDKEKQ